MTARQQIVRVAPLVLLLVLVIAGLRGTVPPPRWNGPLRGDGVAVGLALEAVFGVLLVVVRVREAAARGRPYREAGEQELQPPQALRFTLSYLLGGCMIAIGVLLLVNLHLHLFSAPLPRPSGRPKPRFTPSMPSGAGASHGSAHIPFGTILYALLVIAIVAAVVVTIWWSTRLRRPAEPLVIEDVSAEELREAVARGQTALAAVDDARAAIIACYAAMEQRLAARGTARGAADTPDELLARAVAAGTVRGAAASRLTSLFYEARFSTHPLADGQRAAASAALDELAAELAARPEPAPSAPAAPGRQAHPGGDQR